MARLPENVYIVVTEGEWEWTAVPGDHPNATAEVVGESERRKAEGGVVHVWRVPMAGAAEIDAIPSHPVPPSLAERQ